MPVEGLAAVYQANCRVRQDMTSTDSAPPPLSAHGHDGGQRSTPQIRHLTDGGSDSEEFQRLRGGYTS